MEDEQTVDVAALAAEAASKAVADAFATRDAEAAVKAQRDRELADAAAGAVREELEAKHAAELAATKAESAAGRRLPGGDESGAPYQIKFANIVKYDNLDEFDLAVLHGVLEAAKKARLGSGPSADVAKALAVRLVDSTVPEFRTAKTAMKMAGMPMKSDELNQSDLVGHGDRGQHLGTLLAGRDRRAVYLGHRLHRKRGRALHAGHLRILELQQRQRLLHGLLERH